MKRMFKLLGLVMLLPVCAMAQSYPHYTMFMFNKLQYNPAYAGSRDVTSIDGIYRSQWDGINGAPKTFNFSIDGPVGNYMKPFRRVALGLSVNNEQLGVTNNTSVMAYYAYRIPLEKSILSFGLQAGTSVYTANYSQLNPYQSNDVYLTHNIKNAMLPNFGAGVYWSGDHYYVGASVPNILENYYDKDMKSLNDETSREIRSYFVSGGYVFTLNDALSLEPQAIGRYAANDLYQLPFNADLNLSLIIYQRLLVGVTYRTDKSLEGIIHFQVTKGLNIGYAYDYTVSALNGYNNGTHEVTVGFNFVHDNNSYINPRFVKMF